jgi:hypothetical protein
MQAPHQLAPIDRHMKPADPGLTSGLPRVMQGILARASVPALFPDC